MSRAALLEKIKQAEASASREIEDAEKEQTTAINRIPLDQEALIKKEKKVAEDRGRDDVEKAMKDINKQKTSILKEGNKTNSAMKANAESKIDKAAGKFVDKFLESLS